MSKSKFRRYLEYKQMRYNEKRYGVVVIIALVLFVILGLLTGCKSLSNPLPTNTSDRSRDSVRTEYIHDSVYIERWHKEIQKDDTVHVHDSIDRWRIKYVYIHDSIDNSRTDTIYQKVDIKKKGSAFLRNSGIALWAIIALFVIAAIIGIVLKFAK